MDKQIYIVTKGSYSDYCIVAAFLDEVDADLLASTSSEYRTETYTIGFEHEKMNSLRNGLKPLYVIMGRNGDTESCREGEAEGDSLATTHRIWEQRFGNYPSPSRLFVACWAKDQHHAIKIANEIRVQLISANEWPEDKEDA